MYNLYLRVQYFATGGGGGGGAGGLQQLSKNIPFLCHIMCYFARQW